MTGGSRGWAGALPAFKGEELAAGGYGVPGEAIPIDSAKAADA